MLFFRKELIKFDSGRKIVIITSLLGMILYAVEYSLALFGIIQTIIISVPLTISYVKTRNVYIPIMDTLL